MMLLMLRNPFIRYMLLAVLAVSFYASRTDAQETQPAAVEPASPQQVQEETEDAQELPDLFNLKNQLGQAISEIEVDIPEESEGKEGNAESEKEEDSVFAELGYERPNKRNMSELFVRLGLLNPKDDIQITDFFRINECGIYQRYFQNEFEWRPIKKTLADHLIKNKNLYNNRFFLVIPITVSRYDFTNQSYIVENLNFHDGIRDFMFDEVWRSRSCDISMLEHRNLPSRFIVNFNRPIFLRSIPVNPERAQEIFEVWQENTDTQGRFNRLLYMKVYLTFRRLQTTQDDINPRLGIYHEFIASLDGYEIHTNQNADGKPLVTRSFFSPTRRN